MLDFNVQNLLQKIGLNGVNNSNQNEGQGSVQGENSTNFTDQDYGIFAQNNQVSQASSNKTTSKLFAVIKCSNSLIVEILCFKLKSL